jgi:putative hemolysin
VLRGVPTLAPYAGPIAFGAVVVAITYLSLILGELVPKRLALNGAEVVASRVAGPMRLISVVTSPAVWFLSASTDAVLRLLRVRSTPEYPVRRAPGRECSRKKSGTSCSARLGSTTVRCAS